MRINKRMVKHGTKREPYDYIAESVALCKQRIVRGIINVVNAIWNAFSKWCDAITKNPIIIKFVETYQNVKNERVDIAYEKLGIEP